jgi:hypothetical protein
MQNSQSTSVKFLTIAQFKAVVDQNSLDIVRNPYTKKLFVASEDGGRWKAQQSLDADAPMAFLVEDDDTERACLVNVKQTPSENIVASL